MVGGGWWEVARMEALLPKWGGDLVRKYGELETRLRARHLQSQ